MPHWKQHGWQICDTDVRVGEALAILPPPGGCLIFHCLLHHGTPPSRPANPRWALQYHYEPASVCELPDDAERLDVFGGEGKDANC